MRIGMGLAQPPGAWTNEFMRIAGSTLPLEDPTSYSRVRLESCKPAFCQEGVLRTNQADEPERVASAYKQLWMVEKMFHTMKSILETRPIYHKRDETIRGHVFCSFLALLLKRVLEQQLEAKGETWERGGDPARSGQSSRGRGDVSGQALCVTQSGGRTGNWASRGPTGGVDGEWTRPWDGRPSKSLGES
jgi:hypothetical protein